MARRGGTVGRPWKHSGGFESATSRIYLGKDMLSEWRRLRSEFELGNDNDVTVFLIERNKILTDFLAREGSTVNQWVLKSCVVYSALYHSYLYNRPADQLVSACTNGSPVPLPYPIFTSTPTSQKKLPVIDEWRNVWVSNMWTYSLLIL